MHRVSASALMVGSMEALEGTAGAPQGAAAKQGPASEASPEAEGDEGRGDRFGPLRPQQHAPSRHRMPHAHEWARPLPSPAPMVDACSDGAAAAVPSGSASATATRARIFIQRPSRRLGVGIDRVPIGAPRRRREVSL
jgi:hypothetical protein